MRRLPPSHSMEQFSVSSLGFVPWHLLVFLLSFKSYQAVLAVQTTLRSSARASGDPPWDAHATLLEVVATLLLSLAHAGAQCQRFQQQVSLPPSVALPHLAQPLPVPQDFPAHLL